MHTKYSHGFTLIELLVVIAIIGLLAAIGLATMSTARQKGRDARRLEDMKSVQTALELYYVNASPVKYPTASTWSGLASLVAPTYISSLPNDPGSYAYVYQSTNAATSPAACAAASCMGYVLKAQLEVQAVVTGLTGSLAGITCTPGTTAPFNYCLRE